MIGGADVVVRGRFVNQRVAAAPMEPDGAFAIPDGDGVILWASTQRVHNLRDAVAESLGSTRRSCGSVRRSVGGGFGGKFEPRPEAVVVAAARPTARAARDRGCRRAARTSWACPTVAGRCRTARSRSDAGRHVPWDLGRPARRRRGVPDGRRAHPERNADGARGDVPTSSAPAAGPVPSDQHHADGRLPGRRPARGLRPARTPRRPRRRRARSRPGRAAPPQPRRRRSPTAARPGSPTTPRTTVRASTARSRGSATTRGAPSRPPVGRRGDDASPRDRRGDVDRLHPDEPARRVGVGHRRDRRRRGCACWCGTAPTTRGRRTPRRGVSCSPNDSGCPVDAVVLELGDTAHVPHGEGTGSARSTMLAGGAVAAAGRRAPRTRSERAAAVIARGGGVATSSSRTTAGSRSWAFPRCRSRGSTSPESARCPAEFDYHQDGPTFPAGCHAAVVEVDTATGRGPAAALRRRRRLRNRREPGRRRRPAAGRHRPGGGAGALGGDRPRRRRQHPDVDVRRLRHPVGRRSFRRSRSRPSTVVSPVNVLGAKGIGQAGAIGSTIAVQNAVIDAVSHLGVRHIDLPLTAERAGAAHRGRAAGSGARVTPCEFRFPRRWTPDGVRRRQRRTRLRRRRSRDAARPADPRHVVQPQALGRAGRVPLARTIGSSPTTSAGTARAHRLPTACTASRASSTTRAVSARTSGSSAGRHRPQPRRCDGDHARRRPRLRVRARAGRLDDRATGGRGRGSHRVLRRAACGVRRGLRPAGPRVHHHAHVRSRRRP